MLKAYKRVESYFQTHSYYNSVVHLISGMGLGILITYPIVGPHPVRWGLILLIIGILGHLYPLTVKK